MGPTASKATLARPCGLGHQPRSGWAARFPPGVVRTWCPRGRAARRRCRFAGARSSAATVPSPTAGRARTGRADLSPVPGCRRGLPARLGGLRQRGVNDSAVVGVGDQPVRDSGTPRSPGVWNSTGAAPHAHPATPPVGPRACIHSVCREGPGLGRWLLGGFAAPPRPPLPPAPPGADSAPVVQVGARRTVPGLCAPGRSCPHCYCTH